MDTDTTKPEGAQEDNGDAASIPAEIEAEHEHSEVVRGEWLHSMALRGVDVVQQFMRAVETLQKAAIQATHPPHWVLYKDRDGNVQGVPSSAACAAIRRYLGISVRDVSDPLVSYEKGSKGEEVIVIEQSATGFCALNKETVEKISFAVRSDDDFVGRSIPGDDSKRRLQDLKASCRTGLDSKVTRVLSGVGKVPADMLEANGINIERCAKGRGYGTSSERGAAKVADKGAKEAAADLGKEILKRADGDKEVAAQILADITKYQKKDGSWSAGRRSVGTFTAKWQVEKAVEALKAHEEFGDNRREPGSDDGKDPEKIF